MRWRFLCVVEVLVVSRVVTSLPHQTRQQTNIQLRPPRQHNPQQIVMPHSKKKQTKPPSAASRARSPALACSRCSARCALPSTCSALFRASPGSAARKAISKQKKYKCTVQQGWYDGLERRFRTGTGTGTGSGNRVAYLSVALN